MIKSFDDFILWWGYEQGGTMRGLAKALDISIATIYDWKKKQKVPIRYWKKVERVSEGLFNVKEIYARDIPRFKAL